MLYLSILNIMNFLNLKSPIMIATTLAVIVAILGAIDGVIVRILSDDLHPFVIVFFRCLFGLILVIPLFLKDKKIFQSNFFFLHFFRAFLKICSLVAFFIAIKYAILSDVIAISFITPIFIILGSVLFLREKPTFYHIMLSFVGFAGVLIILKPGQGMIESPLMWAILAAILSAIIQLILKYMSNEDSTNTLVAWNLVCIVPISFVPAYYFWTNPTLEMYFLLSIQGLIGLLNMLFMTRVFHMVDISYVAPYDFLRLPFVTILAFLIFSEIPELSTFIGAIIIFSSNFLIKKLKKD